VGGVGGAQVRLRKVMDGIDLSNALIRSQLPQARNS
jgi:hypothetical protein